MSALFVVRAYCRLYRNVKKYFGFNLKGLGWVQRLIREDVVVPFSGASLFVDHRIATSYGLLPAGLPNEPETIAFLERSVGPETTLVDVGANVGEFVLALAPRVKRVLAFEPHPIAAAALKQSCHLNRFTNVEVLEELVGDGGHYRFDPNLRNANASAIAGRGNTRSARLDERLANVTAPLVFVIDVEGAEPLVLQGACDTIRRLAPLIVFEYNYVSRKAYSLAAIRDLLGDMYRIFRLREDGQLDDDCEHAWNCVAIPRT